MKNSNLPFFIIATSFFSGLFFSNLFIKYYWGINIFLFTLFLVSVTLFLKFKQRGKLEIVDILYIPMLLVSFFPTWHQDKNLIVLDILFLIFGFLSINYITFNSKKLKNFSFLNLLLGQIITPLGGLIGFIPFIKEFSRQISLKNSKTNKLNSKLFINIILGFIITTPIFLVFFVLFLSADEAFAKIIENLNISFNFNQIIIMIIVFIVSLYIFVGLLFNKANPIINNQGPRLKGINATIGIMILTSINILFITFIIVQLFYLFGDHNKVTQLGLTYSEYAKKGFWELQAISILSLFLLYGLKYLFNLKEHLSKYIFMFLINIYIINVLIILFSAHTRMSLYVEGYGYTHLRLYTHIFMLFEAGIFLYLFVDTLFNKKLMPYFVTFMYFYGTIIFSILNFIRPDAYIATYNINRYKFSDKSIDIKYILTLSNEARIKLNDIDFPTKDLYLCEMMSMDKNSQNTYDSLKEYNLSRINNHKKIKKLTDDLDKNKCFNIAYRNIETFLNDYINTAKNNNLNELKKYYKDDLIYNILIEDGEELARSLKNSSNCSTNIDINRSYYSYNSDLNNSLFFSDFPYYVRAKIQCKSKKYYLNSYINSFKNYELYFTINKEGMIKIQSIDVY